MKSGSIGARRELRVSIQVDLTVTLPQDSQTWKTENMGSGGCFIQTEMELEPGEILQVSFALPGLNHVFSCSGEVRWRRIEGSLSVGFAPGVGLRFLGLSDLEKSLIRGTLLRISGGFEQTSLPSGVVSSPATD